MNSTTLLQKARRAVCRHSWKADSGFVFTTPAGNHVMTRPNRDTCQKCGATRRHEHRWKVRQFAVTCLDCAERWEKVR